MIVPKENSSLDTPMMRQYLSIKKEHPRELLFFRMGDFYEMFLDDAKEAAQVLGLTLTSRNKGENAIPMAGVPVRAVDTYLAKLLAAGRRVAICEQTQDPKDAKGLVEREVVRVISPGTITDERLVGEKSNNFIAAIVATDKGYGLSWMDVTTGQFLVWESDDLDAVAAQVSRIDPAEMVLPESIAFSTETYAELRAALGELLETPHPDPLFDHDTAHRCLKEHFRTQSLDGFGCEHLRLATRAGGGLLAYVGQTQKGSLGHVVRVVPYRHHGHVPIDLATRRALELTETYRGGDRAATLLGAFDRTATAVGARMLKQWLLAPLTEVDRITARQDAVGDLVGDDAMRQSLIEVLRGVHDLERLSTRLSYRSANARDLVALRRTLEAVPGLQDVLGRREAAALRELSSRLESLPDLTEKIAEALVDDPPLQTGEGGMIREGHCEELDDLREIASQGTQWIARFQQQEVERTRIPSLKVGYNRVFGYYVEVTNAHKDRVPETYLRKQTLKNCERFVTVELKEYESKVLGAKEQAEELEYRIFCDLRDEALGRVPALQSTAEAFAEIDVLATFARLARDRGYVRPQIDDSGWLRIEDGRHPVVEQFLDAGGFVPNPTDLEDERNIMIITGPNMAGKSTYIRQVALLVLLAQTGSFIPAKSARVGVVDRIFTRVGAADDLARGQSTFMVEMTETANILNNAGPRSLIILDEVGRGTSTFDGVSLAWAVTEHIAEHIRCRTLFATHYHELTAISRLWPAAHNYNVSVREWNDEIIFLRKIVEGGADKSYGIHVARLAGIPRAALDRAREILSNLESQALDLEDRPKLAHRHGSTHRGDGTVAKDLQLDLFRDQNEELLAELKRLDLERMTPLEAIHYLDELKKRIV